MKKRTLSIILILLLGIMGVFVGCGDSTDSGSNSDTSGSDSTSDTTTDDQSGSEGKADENDVTVAYIHSNASIQASVSTELGVNEALKARNLDWNIEILDAFGDTAKLANLIDNAVSKSVDAIIIDYADLRSMEGSLSAAASAGIPVITIDAGGYVTNTVCDITMNNYENAGKLSTWFINKLGPTGNVIVFDLDISAGVRQRCDVFRTVLQESTGIKLIEDYNVDVNRIQQDTMDAMETFLQKYGIDGIDGVYCGWDEAAYAVSKVLSDNGYTEKDCFVTGMDGHWDVSLKPMQDDPAWPQQATVVQAFDAYGEMCVDIIYKLVVKGESTATALNGKTNFYVRAPLVTVDNIADLEYGVLAGHADDYYYGDYTNLTDYVFSYQEN